VTHDRGRPFERVSVAFGSVSAHTDVHCALAVPPNASDVRLFTGDYRCDIVEISHEGPGVSIYDRGTFELRRSD
jgi:hypothetical protein